jgi:hypothetical protein
MTQHAVCHDTCIECMYHLVSVVRLVCVCVLCVCVCVCVWVGVVTEEETLCAADVAKCTDNAC